MTFWALTFDSTVRLSDLVIVLGGIWALVKIYFSTSYGIKALAEAVDRLRKDYDATEVTVSRHHEWLIAAGLDRRTGRERRTP